MGNLPVACVLYTGQMDSQFETGCNVIQLRTSHLQLVSFSLFTDLSLSTLSSLFSDLSSFSISHLSTVFTLRSSLTSHLSPSLYLSHLSLSLLFSDLSSLSLSLSLSSQLLKQTIIWSSLSVIPLTKLQKPGHGSAARTVMIYLRLIEGGNAQSPQHGNGTARRLSIKDSSMKTNASP